MQRVADGNQRRLVAAPRAAADRQRALVVPDNNLLNDRPAWCGTAFQLRPIASLLMLMARQL
jgi:hypothetical protein